jgi:homoserine dehydrogenase
VYSHVEVSPSAHLGLVPSSPLRRLDIGLIGPGKVGTALIGQLHAARARLLPRRLDLRLRAVAASKRMWLDNDDEAMNSRTRGAQTWRPTDLDAFADYLREGGQTALLIDCSASDDVAAQYGGWLEQGIHVVTPNKHAGSGPLERYHAMRQSAALGEARFRYEATVAAGLPVMQTLRDLLDTGDELLAVDGMLSGTLAWLCNNYDGQRPFSACVREAHALGYTEPDPRDDLSGVDVARKLVILAREAGVALSMADVAIESLVPVELQGAGRDAFMARLEEMDAPMAARHAAARAGGCVLRHVAALDAQGRASVSLQALPRAHAFAHTRLTDNIVQFTTRRYCDNPLIVQGPGAGPEVTAAGVFTDILRIAGAMGANVCA